MADFLQGRSEMSQSRFNWFMALGLLALSSIAIAPSSAKDGAIPVDVELVLAVDISYSMDPEEQRLQREGYA